MIFEWELKPIFTEMLDRDRDSILKQFWLGIETLVELQIILES